MHDSLFYAIELIALLGGMIFIDRFVYRRNKQYYKGSQYLCILAAVFMWITVVCIQAYGIVSGLIYGLPAGSVIVAIINAATGLLYKSGY